MGPGLRAGAFRFGTPYHTADVGVHWTMTLTVLLFASYADAFGAPSVNVDLPANATVEDLLVRVKSMHGSALPRALVAVNQEYATAGQRLAAGDEVALIPPVAGG
jgi:molybdopterin converting factor subunit 1